MNGDLYASGKQPMSCALASAGMHALSKHDKAAANFWASNAGILLLWSMFNGFMIPYPQMPVGWKWLNRICPPTWVGDPKTTLQDALICNGLSPADC